MLFHKKYNKITTTFLNSLQSAIPDAEKLQLLRDSYMTSLEIFMT